MAEDEGRGFILGRGTKFYEFAKKTGELMWLNLLTIACSLPVITIGCAFSAMHRVLLSIYRDEEKNIAKEYFASFKENFKHATIIWAFYIIYFGVMWIDDFALRALDNPTISYLRILVPLLSILGVLSMQWFFVLQSRYNLTIKDTIVYSFTRIVAFPLRTLMMGISIAVPVVLPAFFPYILPVSILLGFSGSGLLMVCFYNGALKIMEDDGSGD